ncbi:MAG: nucleotidyltransferase domain-containing protein [Saprospiraceae bacterium]|nr:nucleotidyltransferase domain-containing protein [Saprospiraceae bacterium]
MRATILNQLKEIERQHNIHILYACESGSRAWGFASPDSDWDVRFIYVRSPKWYWSIGQLEDMISFPIGDDLLDVVGWDLRKILALMHSSNATPYEWLQSPIHYLERDNFQGELCSKQDQFFVPRSTALHYLGLATKIFRSSVKDGQINIKKYFYVLRPLLACMWIVKYGTAAPMEFEPLLALLEERPDLLQTVRELTARKMQLLETDTIPVIPVLQDFITAELERCKEEIPQLHHNRGDKEALNEFFRTILKSRM